MDRRTPRRPSFVGRSLLPHAARVILASLVALLIPGIAAAAGAEQRASTSEQQNLVRTVYRELLGIDATKETGASRAADATATRVIAAGFRPQDVRVFKTAPRREDLVAWLLGSGQCRPMLLAAHLDAVEARREEWATNPFELTDLEPTDKGGCFLGRGTSDDKLRVASSIVNHVSQRDGQELLASCWHSELWIRGVAVRSG